MTKDEAMKLALGVLEYWDVHGKLHQPTEEAITALKEALAQPEQEPVDYKKLAALGWQSIECPFCGSSGAQAFPKPEQEPVAWMFQHEETGRMNYVSNDGIHDPTMFLGMNPRYALVCPLYTTPSQRTWVWLTWNDVPDEWVGKVEFMKGAKWAEAKSKEKNHEH